MAKKKTAVALQYEASDQAPKVIATGKVMLRTESLMYPKNIKFPFIKMLNFAKSLSILDVGEYIPPGIVFDCGRSPCICRFNGSD